MAGCATQQFSGVSQGHFDCLVKKAEAFGISISGNVGEASKDGITVRWQFDPAGQTLELQCTGSPFFLSCGTINGKIHDIFDECG
jgi:hypothetical protein